MISAIAAVAQPYYFKTYQVENGLSNNAVLSSLLDKKGFLWLGTRDGLNRFDGYSFKVFLPDKDAPKSLGNNYIHTLYEYDGMIWAGTEKGLFRMNPATEQFDHFTAGGEAAVRDIKADGKGNIWFVADFTLVKYTVRTKAVQRFEPAQYFEASSICIGTDSTLWIATRNGSIQKYDAAHNSFRGYDLYDHSPPAISRSINKIYDSGQGFLLVGTAKQGIKQFDLNNHTYKDILSANPDGTPVFVRDIISKDQETYWIATESGIYIYNSKQASIHHLEKQYSNPWALSDNAVYTLCRDGEGGIWAGTYFGGLNYCPGRYTLFEKFFPIANENSLSGNAVREIRADQAGNLWIGTEDEGLNKLDVHTHRFSNFKPSGKPADISNTNLHGLLLTSDTLWIGTFESGLDLFNIRTNEVIRRYRADGRPGSFASNFVYSITRDHNNEVLLVTAAGVYRALPDRSGFALLDGLPQWVFYTSVLQDRKGLIWAGTSRDGLYCLDPQGHATLYLKNNRINQVAEDSQGTIWITTENGLYQYQRATNTWRSYTTKEGFPSNLMYCVLEDEQQQELWISTSKGLVRFAPKTGQLRVFTKANGLLSDQFNYSSSYKDHSGNMYFGCVKGMIRFNPASFIENRYEPPVYFTGFQVSNRELEIGGKDGILHQSIIFTDTISLPYDQSSFSIDFAALSYNAPEMTQYAYKMDGLREEWTYLSSNRKVYFTELLPGRYLFRLKAANNSGQWSGKERLLYIEVLPPFWASPLAYVLYAITAILIVWLVVRNYSRRARERHQRRIELLEHEKEKEIYRSKIEFFTNVAHEIRNPLTLIKGPLEKALKKAAMAPDIVTYLQMMERNTNRLVELSQQLLDFRQTEKEGFRLSFVRTNVSYLLKGLYETFQPIAEEQHFSYTLQLPERDLFAYLDVETFRKIAGNLIDNALKYGASRVHIQLAMEAPGQHWFLVTVSNDGPLIPESAKEKIFEPFVRLKPSAGKPGSGIGLALARSLATLHHGTLQVTVAEQNTFILRLPVHQDVEFEFKKTKYESNPSIGG